MSRKKTQHVVSQIRHTYCQARWRRGDHLHFESAVDSTVSQSLLETNCQTAEAGPTFGDERTKTPGKIPPIVKTVEMKCLSPRQSDFSPVSGR